MMITIFGLPLDTKYQEVKALIKQECNISDFILDCLVKENNGSKKIRVGVADESVGIHLMKCLDGFRMSGNVLSLVPYGKTTKAVTNSQQPNTYDVRENYQRPDYPNQYNDRNVQPLETFRPTPWANNGNQWSPNQPQAPVQNTFGLQQQPLAPYIQQATQMVKPSFEPREGIPSRAPQNPTFGFPPKSNLISLGPQRNIQSNLRELPEATNRPTQPGKYQSQNYDMSSEKPMTIMKDNFQGPTQYNVSSVQNVSTNFPSQGQISTWNSQPQQQNYEKTLPAFDKKPYEDRKYPGQIKSEISKSEDYYRYEKSSGDFSPQRRSVRESDERRRSPGRRISPSRKPISYSDRRISPDRRVFSSSGRHISPSGRNVSSSGRRDSPPRRQMSPPGRYVSSTGRHASPSARQVSPSGRHVALSSRHGPPPTRHISPSGRRISPTNRHISSTITSKHMSDRQFSPLASQIPIERKISPTRKLSPQMRKEDYLRGRRTSPPTHSPMDRRTNRPSPGRDTGMTSHSCESPRRQSRYSPSRHLGKSMNYQEERNIKDVRPAYEPQSQASNEAMYSDGYRSNVREETKYQLRQEHWQDRDNFSSKSVIEDRREVQRMQQYDRPRIIEQSKEHESRRSRSPKRDRSPVRDRYKRHSPSPRSPRRSWALEKRRSPEVREPPPPPIWPQEREEYKQKTRSKFEPVMEKTIPVWETREKKRDDVQIADEGRNFEEPRRKEVPKWKPIPSSSLPQMSSRFDNTKSTRADLEDRRDYTQGTHIIPRSARPERDDLTYKPNFETKDDMPRKKDEFSGRIEDKKKAILEKQEQLQKEIEEVYKRAVDFTKKAEMYKKAEHKRDPNYDEDRRRNEGRDESKDFHRKRASYEKDRRHDDHNIDYAQSHFTRKDDIHRSDEFTRTRHEPQENQKLRFVMSSAIRAKRNKAIEEISEKIMCKHGDYLPEEVKDRVMNELQWTLRRKLFDMFEDNDVSFIEMVVKFNARHTEQDEEKIFTDVIASLPSYYKHLKRSAKDDSDIPTKSSRRSREPSLIKDIERKESLEKKRRVPVKNMKSSTPSGKGHSSESSKSKERKSSKEIKIDREIEVADVDSIIEENLPAAVDRGAGQFQMNDLMTRVLEDELQTIMIEIWRALPDDPPSRTQKYVAEKLRNEVSDDLRNVIGLNVTKRLLNVFNPLYVKLHFSHRPESGYLTKFLNSYNADIFKRINREKSKNTFVARLRSISDFDKICAAQHIRCGTARITVAPFYNFTKCPAKLNTIFADVENKDSNENNSNDEIINDDVSETIAKESNAEETTVVNKKSDVEDNKTSVPEKKHNAEDVKITVSKTKSNPKEEKPVVPQKKTNIGEVKTSIPKNKSNVEKTGKSESQEVKSAPANTSNVEGNKNSLLAKKINIQKGMSNVSGKKSCVMETKKAITKNTLDNNVKTNSQTEVRKELKKRNFEIDEAEIAEEIGEYDDDDEMNDEEILALIAGGVIVDECSGSDIE